MANHTPETSPSILDRVRSRVSGWFAQGSPTERQGNTNGNLRRRRDSDTETSGEQGEAPPVKKLKSYIVTQTPSFVDTSTPTTSGFGSRRTFLDYSSRPPEPYNFLRSSPLVRHPPSEVVPEVDEEEEEPAPGRRSSSEEEEVEESLANGNDTASESGASMSSASMNIFMKRQSSVINFGSHLQSKKSLFSDKNISMSMSSLNSLSQKRSFNASLYGSTSALSDSRLLNIQSPFYRGRTMFGGASAYSSRPRSRQVPTRPSSSLSNFSSSSASQANAGGVRDEVPLSNTAKRIFEVMNQLSGPLSDVRKMAHSSLTSRPQRFTEQDMQANRAIRLQTPKTPYSRTPSSNATATRGNCVGPMTELQVPSMSQLLQMKKLQSQTEELRKCALDSSSSLNRVTEYKLPDTRETEGKHVNKMRNKITKVRQEVATDDVAVEVKLPDVQLPQLKSVPTFDITFPAVEKKKNGPTEETNGMSFKFSQPIIVGESSFHVSGKGDFKFSEPIDVTKGSLGSVKSPSALPMFSYAPELAKKRPQITVTDTEIDKSPTKPLKVGSSVLEALKSSPLKPVEPPKIVNSFGSQFKAPTNTWECDACLVRNKDSDTTCVACGGPKKGAVKPPAPPVIPPPPDTGFKALMATQNAKWECSGCLLKNDNALQKCPCCEEARPGALKTSTATEVKDEGFSRLVTQQKAKWECTACMTRNEASKTRCACCDQAKPGAVADNVPQFSFSAVPATAKFVFGVPPEKSEATSTVTTASSGFVFGSPAVTTTKGTTTATKESEKTAKESPKGGFIFGNVTTASSVTPEPAKFVFGAPKTATTTESTGKFVFGVTATVTTSTATSSAATVTSSTGGFKFGVPAAVSSAESSVTPKAPPTFTFGAGNVTVSKASEPPVTPVVSSTIAPPKASIVFGTPTTTAATANLFGSSTATASPFSGGSTESPSQGVFKSPMTFGEAAKKPVEFGTAAKATSQPFTFGAAAASTAAPAAFTQTAASTIAPTTQSAVFAFGAAAEAKPQPTSFIFGGAAAKPQEEKAPQPAAPAAASTGFQGFGGFQQPSQSQPAFGSMTAAPTFGSTAAQSPFGGGASAGFGNTAGFGSTPSTNLFGSNAPPAFNSSPAAAQPVGNMFGSVNKPAPFGGPQSRGFDVNDGIEPSTKKTQPSFDFGTPKAADSTNAPFAFGANNNNAPANQPDNKPAFNFSAGQTPNFNFTGSNPQQNSSQPFSFNATPTSFNFETGSSTETGTNAPAFQFGGTTNLFAVTPGQQPRRKMRAMRRVQR